MPISFAGGLHDRDLGFVRFVCGGTTPQDSGFGCCRLRQRREAVRAMDGPNHYDTFTGRWTAPDPIGDKGGDPDWYGYCLDDPVNGVDPVGLLKNEYGEDVPDGRIITEYVPAWICFLGGSEPANMLRNDLLNRRKNIRTRTIGR